MKTVGLLTDRNEASKMEKIVDLEESESEETRSLSSLAISERIELGKKKKTKEN